MQLTQQQKNFFDTFGYLQFPGLLREEIAGITEEFRAVFDDRGVAHTPDKRTVIIPFIDQREKLCTLLDDPRICGIAAGLLGADWNYAAGDGNYYTGDTSWHSDGYHTVGKFIKIAFYLDPVTRDTGALRVIPGSHRTEMSSWAARRAKDATELWGIAERDVPSVALESTPGDVVAFNHNIMHAAFGGSSQRRMFVLNLCKRAETTAELNDLRSYIDSHSRFWIDHLHSDLMKRTASPQRMKHLAQVMELESNLANLTAAARQSMAEASRS